MTISVIVPTYNGAHKITNALRALEQQTRQDFELIIVIDGSTDNTRAVLEGQSWALPNMRIVERANGGRSVSRNTGAREATGELLLFLDDDMRPLPAWIALHVAQHEKKKGAIFVGGALEEEALAKTDFQRYRASLSRKWSKSYEEVQKPMAKENLYLTAANFSIAREVFWQIGGFDERLTDCEDFDLAVRAYKQNVPIYFDAANVAWHDDLVTCKSYIKRSKQYAAAHKRLVTLNPETYQEFNQHLPNRDSFLKKAVYKFFALPMWERVIDRWNILKALPQGLRYRLYSVIVTAQVRYRA